MTDMKSKSTQQLVPIFVALTLLYSLVYHIMMFRAVLQEDVTQDECDQQRHVGGIVPPQCLELEVFKDWHEKDVHELLVESTAPNEEIKADSKAQAIPAASRKKGNTAFVVDESGDSFAVSISEDLAGLAEKYSELVVSSVHLDVKHDVDGGSATPMPLAKSTEALQDLMQHELGEHKKTRAELPASDPVGDFAAFHAQLEERHKKRTEQRAILVQEIAQRMGKLDLKLHDVVSDRKAWESTLLEKYDAANLTGHKHAEPASPTSAFMSKRLQWSFVPTVYHHKEKSPDFLGVSHTEPIVVSKKDVRHLHWTGNLPKVAAIAWIRGDRKTRARMMYFVDNFKLQDYEGPRQLVLVYHNEDALASELARKYADGENVTSVAAHDFSVDMFPSDPALRYAAWASEADVVAQWDFDEWHDPSRLALQVKAMAHTGKHGCVLSTMSTSHSQEDEAKEISVVSLVGERSWMKEHWHPFSRKKLEVNEDFMAGELVELDMQNKALMGNVSRIEHVFKEPALQVKQAEQIIATTTEENKEDKPEGEQGTSFSRGITECLDYDHSKDHAYEVAAEKAMRENVGEDFSKKFHGLVKKRNDITMKLQLLCFETTMEKDGGKRKFMHDHVLEMDGIRVELDKHIKNMASLFGAPNVQ